MIPRQLIIAVAVMSLVVLSMGIYLRSMRKHAVEMSQAGESRPVAPPAIGPTEAVTLYVADDTSGTLRPTVARIPLPGGRQQHAEELLRALLTIYQQPNSSHSLAAAADVRSVYLIEPGTAVIDLNAAFADQHRSGILDEQLTLNSLVMTLATNVQGISRVRILVEGKTRDTLAGHADLSDSIDVNAIAHTL